MKLSQKAQEEKKIDQKMEKIVKNAFKEAEKLMTANFIPSKLFPVLD